MGGGNTCGGDTLLRVTVSRWLTGLWSTLAKVEGIVLKAIMHWGSDSSIVNNPFGESGHTQLYVGLTSVWASVDRELVNWG